MRVGLMAAVAACVMAVPASAATFMVDLKVDLATRDLRRNIDPIRVSTGDQVVLTISDRNGQRLELDFRNPPPGNDVPFLFAGFASDTFSGGGPAFYEFEGLAGAGFAPSGSGGAGSFNTLLAILLRAQPNVGVVSFDSFRVTFTVGPDIDDVALRSAFFKPSTFVPEPTTWAMMVAGFGAIGGGLRRRGARLTYAGK